MTFKCSCWWLGVSGMVRFLIKKSFLAMAGMKEPCNPIAILRREEGSFESIALS